MNDINIKQEMLDLCDSSIEFWKKFKEEIEPIDADDKTELVVRWKDYFVKNHKYTVKFVEVKLHADMLIKE